MTTTTDRPVTIDPKLLDYRTSRLSPTMLRLLIHLDTLADMETHAFVNALHLCSATGLSRANLARALEDCEALGWIVRVYLGERRPVMSAVILTRRIGPGTPAADTPGVVREIKDRLMGR